MNPTRKTRTCRLCGGPVHPDEGITHRDGTRSHEDCADAAEFTRENAAELADHGH